MTPQETKEFIILQADVGHIKDNVSQIEKNSAGLTKSMTRIESKLFNDDATGEKGYIDITKRNAVRLTKLENIKAIGYGVAMAFGIFAGYFFKIKS